ncbi:MAG TPA: hypothetical protein VI702_00750, partial [Nitrospiria bacterium]
GVNKNMAVMLAEATGRYGTAAKKIQQEFTRYPLNPGANAAVQTGMAVTITGASFVSGFNHSESTVPGDSTKYNTNLYSNNGCDNWSGGSGSGDCKSAYEGVDKDPDLDCKKSPCTPYNAAYSGMTEADGHKPAVVTNSPLTAKGSMDAWGGDGTKGWLDESASNTFPSLEKMLGLEDYPDVVQAMKDNANKDPNACPSGFTYIDNAQSQQVYKPSKIANCPSGSGVMVVTGDLDITSQFEFRGLIYVLGDASLGGGSWTLGSMAVKGVASGVKLAAGNPTVLYSKATVAREVMRAAMTNGAAFNILSWREVTSK